MNRYLIPFALFLFTACNSGTVLQQPKEDNLDEMASRNTDSDLSTQEKYEYENLQIQFDDPINFASTKNVAIPIIYEEIERDKMDYDRIHFNIAILTDTTSEPFLIFPNPVEITSIETVERQITYKVETHDFDSDYYYDDEDDNNEGPQEEYTHPAFNSLLFIKVKTPCSNEYSCTILYLYDLKNLKLYQLNEDGTDFISWESINNEAKIMVKYHVDNNHDNQLDDKDDQNMQLYDLKTHTLSPSVFDIEMLRKMKLNLVKSKH
jgi:hypothetical protein